MRHASHWSAARVTLVSPCGGGATGGCSALGRFWHGSSFRPNRVNTLEFPATPSSFFSPDLSRHTDAVASLGAPLGLLGPRCGRSPAMCSISVALSHSPPVGTVLARELADFGGPVARPHRGVEAVVDCVSCRVPTAYVSRSINSRRAGCLLCRNEPGVVVRRWCEQEEAVCTGGDGVNTRRRCGAEQAVCEPSSSQQHGTQRNIRIVWRRRNQDFYGRSIKADHSVALADS